MMIPSLEKPNIKRASWESIGNEIEGKMSRQPTINSNEVEITKETVDEKLKKCYKNMEEAIKNHIPITKYTALPHPINSEKLKLIQWHCNNIQNTVLITG